MVRALDLKEFYLYGSSWGTVLAQEFAVTQPDGLLGMVLDGALADAQVYIKTQWRDRISQLPSYTQRLLTKLEKEKQQEAPAYVQTPTPAAALASECTVQTYSGLFLHSYKVIEAALTRMFTVRTLPQPECFTKCFEEGQLNQPVSVQRCGE